jgi:hypothetical protein
MVGAEITRKIEHATALAEADCDEITRCIELVDELASA